MGKADTAATRSLFRAFPATRPAPSAHPSRLPDSWEWPSLLWPLALPCDLWYLLPASWVGAGMSLEVVGGANVRAHPPPPVCASRVL